MQQLVAKMQVETKSLLQSVIQLVYYMKGSVGYEEMMRRTPMERDLMASFVKELEGQ